jgi:hypothetical protein
MKSRFFFGVFVGFILASLFFFFFFRVGNAQTPTASPQSRAAAYGGNVGNSSGGRANEVQYDYTAANYYAPAEYHAYSSYAGNQGKYGYELAEYKSKALYDDATSKYYEPVTYHASYTYSRDYARYEYKSYDDYQLADYASVS